MNFFILNSGSSSIKYQLIDMSSEKVLAKGLIEKIGLKDSITNYEAHHLKEKIVTTREVKNHKEGIKDVLNILMDDEKGVIKSPNDIYAVGHRVVHGGEKFQSSVLIDDEVIRAIEDISDLAPLHNPANLLGIRASKEVLGNKPNVAVFDTSFHQTMPPKAYTYGLKYDCYEGKRIRRYGFHGTSHHYVSKEAAILMGKDISELKLITCHLGNGSSICAVDKGKSVDTSLGYGTMSGVIMGTRAGDLDPTIIIELMEKFKMDVDEIKKLIYKESGLQGISGISFDMREVLAEAQKGNKRATLSIDMLSYSIIKYIGSYVAVMNGVDGIIFTAGIGENDTNLREEICKNLTYLGIDFDTEKNKSVRGKKAILTKPSSKVKVMLIPTNEELMIAQITKSIVEKNSQ